MNSKNIVKELDKRIGKLNAEKWKNSEEIKSLNQKNNLIDEQLTELMKLKKQEEIFSKKLEEFGKQVMNVLEKNQRSPVENNQH